MARNGILQQQRKMWSLIYAGTEAALEVGGDGVADGDEEEEPEGKGAELVHRGLIGGFLFDVVEDEEEGYCEHCAGKDEEGPGVEAESHERDAEEGKCGADVQGDLSQGDGATEERA